MATREELLAELMRQLGITSEPISTDTTWLKDVAKLGSVQPNFEMSYDSVTPRYADGSDPNASEMFEAFDAINAGVPVDSILATGTTNGVTFSQQNIADLDKYAQESSSRAQANAKYDFTSQGDMTELGLPSPNARYTFSDPRAQLAGLIENQNLGDFTRASNYSKNLYGQSSRPDPNMTDAMAMTLAQSRVPKAQPSNMDRLTSLPSNFVDSAFSFLSGSKDNPEPTNAEVGRDKKVLAMQQQFLTGPKDRQQANNDYIVMKSQERMLNSAKQYDALVAELVTQKLSAAGITPFNTSIQNANNYSSRKK